MKQNILLSGTSQNKFFTRRVLLVLLFLLSACRSSRVGEADRRDLGPQAARRPAVLQGVTTESTTAINLLRHREQSMEVKFLARAGAPAPTLKWRRTHEWPGSDWVLEEFYLTDLDPTLNYDMTIFENRTEVDRREFSSLARSNKVRFAVVSCSDDKFIVEQKSAWTSLQGQNPHFVLAIGDNVYTDRGEAGRLDQATPEVMWRRYVQTRQSLDVFFWDKLVPMFAVWDDHDFGVNDGDRRYPHKAAALEVMRSFFPQGEEGRNYQRGPGAASRVVMGDYVLMLLDNRSFRSPNGQSPICQKVKSEFCSRKPKDRGPDAGSDETHFGQEQEQWMDRELDRLGQKLVFMISGNEWFGGYSPFESFEGSHPKSFGALMSRLAQKTSRFVFVGGDRHLSEINSIEPGFLGYETREIVSSPIHGFADFKSSPTDEFPNPRRIVSTRGVMNFSLIDLEQESPLPKQKWTMIINNFDYLGGHRYKHEFSIAIP